MKKLLLGITAFLICTSSFASNSLEQFLLTPDKEESSFMTLSDQYFVQRDYSFDQNITVYSNEFQKINFLEETAIRLLVLQDVLKSDEIADDKQKHYIAGEIISRVSELTSSLINDYYGKDFIHPKVFALGITSIIAGLKELRDAQGHGTPELEDFYYTIAPALMTFKFEYKF